MLLDFCYAGGGQERVIAAATQLCRGTKVNERTPVTACQLALTVVIDRRERRRRHRRVPEKNPTTEKTTEKTEIMIIIGFETIYKTFAHRHTSVVGKK